MILTEKPTAAQIKSIRNLEAKLTKQAQEAMIKGDVKKFVEYLKERDTLSAWLKRYT